MLNEDEYNPDLYWSPKEGEDILISEMETSHIGNAIAMLIRRAEKIVAAVNADRRSLDPTRPESIYKKLSPVEAASRIFGKKFDALVAEERTRIFKKEDWAELEKGDDMIHKIKLGHGEIITCINEYLERQGYKPTTSPTFITYGNGSTITSEIEVQPHPYNSDKTLQVKPGDDF